MTINELVEFELSRYPWNDLQTADGHAGKVPAAIKELLLSKTEKESDTAYRKLDNSVIVQGCLYEAAASVVTCLLAGLTSDSISRYARGDALDLLFQILNGYNPLSSATVPAFDVLAKCRENAKPGLWLFYHYLTIDELPEAHRQILESLEEDEDRLSFVKAKVNGYDVKISRMENPP